MSQSAVSDYPTEGQISVLLGACADVHVLAALPWSAVVVDRRQRSRSAAGKAQLALQVSLTSCWQQLARRSCIAHAMLLVYCTELFLDGH
jgi:hypothetical protein